MDTKKLRQKILDLAIRGKLVPQDPNDEPASVLLERIKAEKEKLIKEGKIKKSKQSASVDSSPYEKFADGTVKCVDEEIPFDLPKGWEWCRLQKCISLLSGRDLAPTQYNAQNIGIPYIIGASNFSNGVLEVNRWTNQPVTISQYGELLITCKGTIGAMAYNNIGDIHIARQIMAIRSFGVNIEYIELYLSLYVSNLQKAARGVIPGISRDDILDSIIPIPPLAEQYRIASEVERLFALIDEIEEDKASLEEAIKQAKRKVLELAVTGKLCNDNRHYEKYAQTTLLGNLCKLVDGSKITNKKMPYLDVKFLRGKSEAHLLSEGQFVPKGTNMILVDGENSGEIFTAPIDGYKGSTFKLLSFDSSVNTEFILLFIRANQSKFKESKVGSAIPHLNKKLFKSLEIALPSFEEQEVVVNRVNTINNALDEIALHTI